MIKTHSSRILFSLIFIAIISKAIAQAPSKPNIIIIYADDLGWNQLSCYGNTKIKTPNIDALAVQGVRFTQAYATAPICSPSRMGLLTGRYQQRFGGEFLVPELSPPVLPEHLKAKVKQEQITRKSMFETVDTAAYSKLKKGIPLSEKLISVHDPFQAKRSEFDKITTSADTTERIYLAILKSLDDAVGRIMAKLKEEGLDKNTLVFFGSDNGGASYSGQMTNAPLRGGKQSDFEGGIRVPLIIKYPGHIKEGIVYDKPVSNLDIFATSVAAAKVILPKDRVYDGVNILPYVNGENSHAPHPVLFWRNGFSKAMRKGDWKLYINERANTTLLYNIADDLEEQHDLSSTNTAKLDELKTDMAAWESHLAKPVWPFVRSELMPDIKDYQFYFPN